MNTSRRWPIVALLLALPLAGTPEAAPRPARSPIPVVGRAAAGLRQAGAVAFRSASGPAVMYSGAHIEILEDLHTVGTGVLSGFDLRYSNRSGATGSLEVRLYAGSPSDGPPGALLAGPYLLANLPPDPPGVIHEVHVDVPDTPAIPTTHLWVGITGSVASCGAWWSSSPPSVGSSHPDWLARPPGTPASNPYSMLFTLYVASLVGVADPAAPAADLTLAPRPNPAGAACRLEFALPAAGRARLAIYDAAGRAVRTLIEGELPAGGGAALWDLRDRSGARVRPGIYWARLEAGSRTRTQRLAVR